MLSRLLVVLVVSGSLLMTGLPQLPATSAEESGTDGQVDEPETSDEVDDQADPDASDAPDADELDDDHDVEPPEEPPEPAPGQYRWNGEDLLGGLGVTAASSDYTQVVGLTFPLAADARYGSNAYSYSNDYYGARSRGIHGATDVMTDHGTKVYAVVGGRVDFITGLDNNPPSYGYMIRIAGDDGRGYAYIHLGRQDGPASGAYVSGLSSGTRVQRGQHIGYAGSSGNASPSAPHLHLEIHDSNVTATSPDGSDRVNPYFSLRDAERRRDFPAMPLPDKYRDSFRDIAGTVHRDTIADAYHGGLVSGCRAEYYCPTDPVSREQMATFIVRAAERLGPRLDEAPFVDVTAASSHGSMIAELFHHGIVQGVERDGQVFYAPLEPVTRGQMATFIIASILDIDPVDGDSDFADVGGDHVHRGSINALVDAGIALGFVQDGTPRFRPNQPVTRGQMATFLRNARSAGL